MQAILSKRDGARLFMQGQFGNRIRQWDTPDDLMLSDYPGEAPVTIRARAAHGGGPCLYDIPKCRIMDALCRYPFRKLPRELLYFNETLRKSTVTMQGEVAEFPGGWYLRYSTLPDHMRPALAQEPREARGLRAMAIAEHFMDARSYQCLRDLMEKFPGHVVEFTCASEPIGDLRWNSIIWEVRRY